jgi:hypothetical protein
LKALALDTTDQFLREFAITVTNLYIMYIVIAFFNFASKIALLAVIYSITTNRIQHMRSTSTQPSSAISWTHKGIVLILTTVAVASIYCFARLEIAAVLASSSLQSYQHDYATAISIFQIIYLLAALEVLLWAVAMLFRGGKKSSSGKVSTSSYFSMDTG